VPGVALHPSGALLYEPFLDGAPPPASACHGKFAGGVDIRDAHSGRLRLRLYLPEPFAMLSTDTDGLHGTFLTLDEKWPSAFFALTTSGVTVLQLFERAAGNWNRRRLRRGPSAGGTSLTIRGQRLFSRVPRPR